MLGSLIETLDDLLDDLTMPAPATLGRVSLSIEPNSDLIERLAGVVVL
jgi:hypothetical protein